jgi:Cu/Ag efflux protein CusF
MKLSVKATLIALSLAFGTAFAADAPATAAAATPGAVVADSVKVEAEVMAVDMKTRTVTLKGPEGNVFDVVVGKGVKNLGQVKVGDRVVTEYFEALAIKLKKGGGLRETVESSDMQRAQPGQKPGAMKTREVSFVADVMEVDTKASTITVLGAKGRVVKLKIKDPAVLADIKQGDQIEGTYIQATALVVVPAKAAK